ncbi:MAG TPA: response regulator [Burkholderiales bacterium]|nr:response regulator [Burkholderiales bacterium]
MTTPERIGKYEIERVLGRGGMSTVYQALDPAIERSVALKVIDKSMLGQEEARIILDRFRYEAQAAGRLFHPSIVTIFEYGEDDEHAYIAMELVRGNSLHELLLNHVPTDLARVRDIILPLLAALEFSHEQGVTHRDIKPSNVLLDENGRIKVSDFGIARIESNTLTQFGLAVGTPYYMSPEQCLGDDTDARTDVYSVGVIAYELLTGRRPFAGKGTNATIMREVLDTVAPDPSEFNPRVTAQMDWVIQKALAKKLDERYQTAREFSADFKLAIEDCLAAAATAQPDIPLEPPATSGHSPEPAPSHSPDRAPESASRPKLGSALMSAARKLSGLQPKAQPPAQPAAETAAPTTDVAPSGAPAGAPAAAQPAETPPPAATQPVTGSQPVAAAQPRYRVLFVDDEERILSALKSIFRAKYHVFTATDGVQAVEFLKRFRVHLIVSDQRMPNMTGVEMLRRAKEMSPNTVRILLTGYSDLASIVGSINDGEVYRFINKPWNNQDIQSVVAEACTIGAELWDVALPQGAAPEKMEEAILVVDPARTHLPMLQELFGDTYNVLHAASLSEALATMASRPVAVIVADIGQGVEEDTATFKLLKQEHPEILAIVLTDASDSERVIELINQAQVFRFVNKPVNVKLLNSHVQAALVRYQQFRAAPKLLQTQKVSVSEKLRSSRLGQALVGRIKSLRGLFGAGSATR